MTSRVWINPQKDVLYVAGMISGLHVSAALRFVMQLGDRAGTIIINSQGGEELEAMALFDILIPFRAQLTSVAIGQVQSAAVLPFLACDRRLASDNSRFMYHHGTYETNSPEGQREMVGITKELVAVDETYISIIAARTGMPKKDVRRRTRFGHFFGTKAALREHFVTGRFDKMEVVE